MNRVKRENEAVLALLQAMLGSISSNFRRVSLSIVGETIQLQFVLARESEMDREEISDMTFVFESLYNRQIEVEMEIVVTTKPLSEIPSLHRVLIAHRSLPRDVES